MSSGVTIVETRFNPDLNLVRQERGDRNVHPWIGKRLWSVSDSRFPIGRLVSLQPDGSGAVYGLDRGSGCVIALRPEGAEELCFRNETSKLLIPISNYALDGSDGSIIGMSGRSLWRRSPSGRVEKLRDSTDISSFTIERDRLFYLAYPPPDQKSSFSWLEKANFGAEPGRVGPALISDSSKAQFAVMGKIVGDDSSNMLYHVSDRCGLLIGLANDPGGARIRFARTTIDEAPLPKLEKRKMKGAEILAMPFGHPIVAIALGVDRGRLYVMTREKVTAKTFKLVLDAYNGGNGDYVSSFELPSTAHVGFCSSPGKFYLQTENSIEAWTAPAI